jgi:coenzyme F420-0:L-glutamate ligase/coenzyme F420-1:gamma-L-glutamate ligase
MESHASAATDSRPAAAADPAGSGDWRHRIVAVVPIRSIEGSKSRLGGPLDAEEREAIVTGMLARTIRAARGVTSIASVVVVSPDASALRIAESLGATPLRQSSGGLNEGLELAQAWARDDGATAIIVLPADLPNVGPDALERFLASAAAPPEGSEGQAGRATEPRVGSAAALLNARPATGLVALVPDRHGEGTNLLLVAPPGLIPFAFGPGSRARHGAAATNAHATVVELAGPLGLDLDTPDDLLLIDFAQLEHEGRRLLADGSAHVATSASTNLSVIPLIGIPEVVPGTDLPGLLAAAIAATPGVLPLHEDDVLVVTQKIVSKAEGAIVDLDPIVPRPEAVAFAERWDRDPRQVEVVLQQARRVIRMANGVVIVETKHGFICANGGIDASNVGPASGHIVLLLPEDSDASAAGIRERVRADHGVDVPVIISDSFGRPWRWGIVDVAIGVSGLHPLEDLRGRPDADGRVMHSTVRAVADEIASAVELVLGKTAGRPAAIVRGARPPRGEGSIREALMPPEFDLFP